MRAERIRMGLSQTALAGDDFSPSYISLIEAGRRSPSEPAIRVLAQRLDVSVEYLRDGATAPSEERARLELGFARLALTNGEAGATLERLRAIDLGALPLVRQDEVTRVLAEAHEMLGDYDEAVDLLEPMLKRLLDAGRWSEGAVVATRLVATYHEAGDLTRAVERGEEVLLLIEEAGLSGTDEHLRLASTLLWIYYERGDLLFARHRADALTSLAEESGSARGRGSVYWNAALVLEERGEITEARRLTERALAYLGEEAPGRDVPRLRVHYGWLLLQGAQPEPREAIEQLTTARARLTEVGSVTDLARCTIHEGRAHLLLGDAAEAEAKARAVLAELGDQSSLDRCAATILLGDALAARGDQAGATQAYTWAADRLAMLTASRAAAAVWRTLGDRLVERGDLEGAVRAYDQALTDLGVRETMIDSPVDAFVLTEPGEPLDRHAD